MRKGIEHDDDGDHGSGPERRLEEHVRPAPALPLPGHVAPHGLSGDRRPHDDHALLPLLRGGGGHSAASALLPHVVPVLLVPARGVERHRRVQRVHRRALRQNRSGQPHHLRHVGRRPDPTPRHPAHHGQVGVRRLLLRDRVRGRRDPGVHAGTHARLFAPDGSRRRHGVLGAWANHGRALRQPGGDPHARAPQALAGPIHHLGLGVPRRRDDLVLFPAASSARNCGIS